MDLELIREKIKNCGISQTEISKRAGVSPSQLSRFVNGKSVYDDAFVRIINAAGLVITYDIDDKVNKLLAQICRVETGIRSDVDALKSTVISLSKTGKAPVKKKSVEQMIRELRECAI